MNATSSRREKREAKFYFLAEQGKMLCNEFTLFKSEERTLRDKCGFDVTRYGTELRRELRSVVSWEKAFKNGIPLLVINYCTGTIETFPKSAIESWAQELFVIAARAIYQKDPKAGKQLLGLAQATGNE